MATVLHRGLWWWDCSAAIGRIAAVDTRNQRKKFEAHKAHMHTTARRANTAAGLLKGIDLPLPTMLISEMTWYGGGNPDAVERLLSGYVHAIGKRRNTGLGMVDRWAVEAVSEAERTEAEYEAFPGEPARPVPDTYAQGRTIRWVRLHPPYWDRHDRVRCVVPPDWAVVS